MIVKVKRFKNIVIMDYDFLKAFTNNEIEPYLLYIEMWQCITALGIKPFKDGNQWCFLYGDNIQEGICGFGDTIDKAAWDFYTNLKSDELLEKQVELKTPNIDEMKFKVGGAVSVYGNPLDYEHASITQKDFAPKCVNGTFQVSTKDCWRADKPKFQNGQWIVWQDKCYKVNYNGCGYELVDQNGFSTSLEYGTIDENAHLWTIKDAKDGDILVASDGSIFIFKEVCGTSCKHYVAFTKDDTIQVNYNLEHFWESSKGVHPETKEQRETLFKAMADTGYEWNPDKKELKKIHVIDDGKAEMDYCFTKMMAGEKVSPAWSEEDEKMLDNLITYLDGRKNLLEEIKRVYIDWLKSLKDRVQPKQAWSGGDEAHLHSLITHLEQWIESNPDTTGADIQGENVAWLKSLRPQTKKEWDKADKEYRDAAIYYLRSYCNPYKVKPILEWLEELEPKSHWKPSDEQMLALNIAIEMEDGDILKSLYDDLKKLKEE